MKHPSFSTYAFFNILFIGILVSIFVYSGVFSADENNHPIDCYFAQRGIQCPTCGISRGFSEIMEGHLSRAQEYNANSLRLFLFFVIQLLLRIVALVVDKRINKTKQIVIVDGFQAALLAIICFYPIFKIWLQGVSQLI